MTPTEIKKIRLSFFLTQKEFAKKLGTTRQRVNAWENNKIKPSLRYAKKINEFKNLDKNNLPAETFNHF